MGSYAGMLALDGPIFLTIVIVIILLIHVVDLTLANSDKHICVVALSLSCMGNSILEMIDGVLVPLI